jgi:hypothetical protein
VLPRTYENQVCSIARTLEVIGDRWTMLIIRGEPVDGRSAEARPGPGSARSWPSAVL